MKTLFHVMLTAVLLTTLNACTTVTVSEDGNTVATASGALMSSIECTTTQAQVAAGEVLAEYGFALTDTTEKDGRTTLTARGAKDKKYTIQISPVSEKLTSIQVRGPGSAEQGTQLLLLRKIREAADGKP